MVNGIKTASHFTPGSHVAFLFCRIELELSSTKPEGNSTCTSAARKGQWFDNHVADVLEAKFSDDLDSFDLEV